MGILLFGSGRPLALAAESTLPVLIKQVEPSVVRIETESAEETGTGSGFIVDGGFVVTNYHVIDKADSARVTFSKGNSADVVGVRAYDPTKDLVLLEIDDAHDVVPLEIAEDLPRKGENVVAFGAPKGFSFTVTQGIVSGIRTGDEIKALLSL